MDLISLTKFNLFKGRIYSTLNSILKYYVETVSIRKRSYKTEVYRIKALTGLVDDLVRMKGGIHVQNVNAYHSRFRGSPERFHGVATHYLPTTWVGIGQSVPYELTLQRRCYEHQLASSHS
jgi:hypothetical protein